MTAQPQVILAPPFTRETAAMKVRKAEDAWNSRDPQHVALAYTFDSHWRNRAEFINGREQIIQFLTRKWNRELEYRLIKELWAFDQLASPCALPTNGTTIPASGIAPTAMKIGNTTSKASCITAMRPSTTCRSRIPSGSITGRKARARKSIPG